MKYVYVKYSYSSYNSTTRDEGEYGPYEYLGILIGNKNTPMIAYINEYGTPGVSEFYECRIETKTKLELALK